MSTNFETSGCMKFWTQDDYERGNIGTESMSPVDLHFVGATVTELVAHVCEFFGVDRDAVEIGACAEPDRVDVHILECDDSTQAGATDIERWKRGEQSLWDATYTFRVERVTREPAVLLTATP